MDRDEGELARRLAAQQATADKDEDESSAEGYAVATGVARERDAEAASGAETSSSEEDPEPQLFRDAARDPFDPLGIERPPDMRETVDVAATAPDGTALPERGTFTSPMGESIGGNSVSDSVTSRADEFGHGALGDRGIGGVDFDPFAPGTQGEGDRPGSEGGGDPEMDRLVMGHDGSMISAPRELKKADPNWTPPKNPAEKGGGGDVPKELRGKDFDKPATAPAPEDKSGLDTLIDAGKSFLGFGDDKDKDKDKMENPDGDGGANEEANLERVTVMQGSRGQPSNNPDDADGTGTSTDNFIPRGDLVTNPREEAVADTTLTHTATLGSSPVTNPTDPALGDDGIITGGNYGGGGSAGGGESSTGGAAGGGGSGGGGEVTPTSMAGGDSSSASPVGDVLGTKQDANGVEIDMATGQVVGSAAPAVGGELRTGDSVAQGDEDGDDDGVQAFTGTHDAALAMGGTDTAFASDSLSPAPPSGGMPPGDDPDAAFGPHSGEG